MAQGGFYRRPGIALACLVAAATLFAFVLAAPNRSDINPISVGCALLLLATVVSAVVHGDIGTAAEPGLLLVGAAAAAAAARRLDDEWSSVLRRSIVGVGLLIAATGWYGSAFHAAPLALVAGGLWRGASTLTYANAAGAGIAMTLPFVVVEENPRVAQGLAFALLTGLGATLSRGAIAAAAVAFVFLWFTDRRHVLRRLPAPGLGAAVAVGGLIVGMPASGPPRPFIASLALVVGFAISLLVRVRVVPLVIIGAGVAAAILFSLTTSPVQRALRDRVGASSDDRSAEWRQSWHLFANSPAFGTGPGRFELRYREGDEQKVAQYAHNEYLQIATETGVLGLSVTVAGLIAIWIWVRRSAAEYRSALLASAVAASVDFSWHFPVIVLLSALVAGLAHRTRG